MMSLRYPAFLSSVTFAVAAQGAEPPVEPKYSDPVCTVIMDRQKTPVTAHVRNRETHEVLFVATALNLRSDGAEGAALDGAGNPAGTLIIRSNPKSDDNTASLKPLRCEVGGRSYPAVIPDKILNQLFAPKTL